MSFSFKQFSQINEMKASPMVYMPLEEVIAAGKVTNTVQIMVMAQLIGSLKHFEGAAAARYMNEVYLTGGTPASMIKSLREMPEVDQVHLARELLRHIRQEYDITPDNRCGTASNINYVSDIQK